MIKGPLGKHHIIPLGISRGGSIYLLNDDFLTLQNPPLISPRTAEPGPGTLTKNTDTGNYGFIDADGRFTWTGGSGGFTGNPNYAYGSVERVNGRMLALRITTGAMGSFAQYGLYQVSAVGSGWTQVGEGIYINNVTLQAAFNGPITITIPFDTLLALTTYDFIIILHSAGADWYGRVGVSSTYRLMWQERITATATLYPYMVNNNTQNSLDYIRVRDLPAPFTSDYGIASFHVTSFTQSVGAELLANPSFDDWTTDNPNSWTVLGEVASDPMVTEVDAAGGAGTDAARIFSSATNFQPSIRQAVLAANSIYEISVNISQRTSGTINLQIGVPVIAFTSTGVKNHVGRASSVNAILYGGIAPHDLVLSEVSAKLITLNAAQVSAADAIHDFGFTVPASPVANQEIHLLYRISVAGDEFLNCWDAYLQRNAANSAWDFRLDSISAGTRTNRIAVTGVTADMIRVICNGSLHDCYTKSGTTWTKRGGQINVSHLDHATGVNTVYSTGTTPGVLDSFPIRAVDYDSALTLNPPTYLLLDRFYTSVAAGALGATFAMEPGPGTWTVTDGNSLMRKVGGKISKSGTGAASDNPQLVSGDISRVPGRALIIRGSSASVARGFIGFRTAGAVKEAGFEPFQFLVYDVGGLATGSLWSNINDDFAVVLFATGAAFLVRSGGAGYWKLIHVGYEGNTATLNVALADINTTAVWSVDDVMISDLGATFDAQSDLATVHQTSFGQSAGSELVSNGNFAAWTADNPDGWTVLGEVASDPMVNEVGAGQGQGGAGTGLANLYSSATNSNPILLQGVLTQNTIYEISVLIDTRTAGTLNIQQSGGGQINFSYTTTGQKIVLARATQVGANLQFLGGTAPTDITIDNVTVKALTLNTAQVMPADADIDFLFTLPASPVAGQRIALEYRIQNPGEELFNCWEAAIVRNDANNNWDFRLDSILAGFRTNRIAVTGVGAVDGIKVNCEASSHDCYTRASGVWTKRGATVAVAHMDASRGCNTIYSTGTTAPDLWIYPRTGVIETSPLVNVTVDTQTLGAELFANPSFTAWTADDPDGWTESGESGSDPEVTQRASGELNAAGDGGLGSANFFSSATIHQPRLSQSVMVIGGWYELTVNISARASGSPALSNILGARVASWVTTGVKRSFGVANSVDLLFFSLGSPGDWTIDELSLKRITPNPVQVATADGVWELALTLPGSPVASQQIQLQYRVQDSLNYWVAYLQRNDANNAWDVRLDSVVAGVQTNRINVTGVGTPDSIRVRALGLNHVIETGVAGVWTYRGVFSSSILQGAVLTNYIYSSGFTFGSLKFYKFTPSYSLLDGI